VYLLIGVLSWAFKFPWLVALALMFFFFRNRLPDPLVWLQTERRVRELSTRIEALPADLLSRRDLARALLARGRAPRARALLEEAIAKGLNDPETYYLLGIARLHCREPDQALEPFVRSVARSERALMGEPYLAAAEALFRLSRYEEAEDAVDRALTINSSRVDAYVTLATIRRQRGDAIGAKKAYESAVHTWNDLPDFLRWKMLKSYIIAQWTLWFGF
jgi:tetratricopeptide (TPR) repeat protein